jgi:DNA-binding NtrC family response regulator
MARILVIDKEPRIQEALVSFLEPLGHSLDTLSAPEAAFSKLRKQQPDIVFAEAENSGLELMQHVREQHPEVAFILTSSLARKDTAIQALRGGASDLLVKPFTAREATDSVKRALAVKEGRFEEAVALRTTTAPTLFLAREGTSENAVVVRKQIDQLLANGPPGRLLITGAKGTGKYELASLLHHERSEAVGRFVVVDCQKLRADAMRAQLAYQSGSPGKAFVEAAGGTVVIENAHLLPDGLQAELLESTEGGDDAAQTIFSTTDDLAALVKKSEFNPDLYEVLKETHIHLVPLDKRKEDIPAMVDAILRSSASLEEAARKKTFSAAALKELGKRKFPGNMAELEKLVVTTVLASAGSEVDKIL